MNNPLTWVVLLLALGGATTGILNYIQPLEVENTKVEKEVVEVHPDWSTDEEAVAAAQAVIDRKRAEGELEVVQSDIAALKATYEASLAELVEKETALEKELLVYGRDVNNIKQLVADTFPEAPQTALAIVACESGFQTDIQSKNILSYGREQSFGLFQIHAKVHHQTALRLGLPNYKTDPEQNAKMARHIYEAAGHSFQPWTCYKKNLVAMR